MNLTSAVLSQYTRVTDRRRHLMGIAELAVQLQHSTKNFERLLMTCVHTYRWSVGCVDLLAVRCIVKTHCQCLKCVVTSPVTTVVNSLCLDDSSLNISHSTTVQSTSLLTTSCVATTCVAVDCWPSSQRYDIHQLYISSDLQCLVHWLTVRDDWWCVTESWWNWQPIMSACVASVLRMWIHSTDDCSQYVIHLVYLL